MISYSTAHLPPKSRISYWNELNRRLNTPAIIQPLFDQEFEADLKSEVVGQLSITKLYSSPVDVGWKEDFVITPTAKQYVLVFNKSGSMEVSRHGSNILLTPGDFILFESNEPTHSKRHQSGTAISVQFPETLLTQYLPTPDLLCGYLLSSTHGFGKTVAAMITTLWDQAISGITPRSSSVLTKHFLEILASSFSLASIKEKVASETLFPATMVRRAQITAYVEKNLRNPDITLNTHNIASVFNISERYLRMVFSEANESLSRYILRRRLEECARELTSDLWKSKTITDIAFRWGFNSAPHFTRVFREFYLTTPQKFRNQHNMETSQ